VFTDLEVAVRGSRAGRPTRDPEFLHAAEPAVLDCLKRLNVSLLAHSNNHAFDLNTGGIVDALDAMTARGFVHAGTGRSLEEARAPARQQTRRGTVALVALATGRVREGGAATPTRPGVHEVRRSAEGALNEDDVGAVLASLGAAAATADVVVLYHHNHYWETDIAITPEWQKAFARRCVEAGASVYVSHGAPLLHGVEVHRGAPIFHGLGSFIFQTTTQPGRYPPAVWESVIAECEFSNGRFLGAHLVPVLMNATGAGGPGDLATRGRPAIVGGAKGREIIARFASLARPYGTTIEARADLGFLRPG
jgi:poly-gamma-glutamate synthesis protein (capsule biosynthesis protein)